MISLYSLVSITRKNACKTQTIFHSKWYTDVLNDLNITSEIWDFPHTRACTSRFQPSLHVETHIHQCRSCSNAFSSSRPSGAPSAGHSQSNIKLFSHTQEPASHPDKPAVPTLRRKPQRTRHDIPTHGHYWWERRTIRCWRAGEWMNEPMNE